MSYIDIAYINGVLRSVCGKKPVFLAQFGLLEDFYGTSLENNSIWNLYGTLV